MINTMKPQTFLSLLLLSLVAAAGASAQTPPKKTGPAVTPILIKTDPIRSSPAYAELLLRKTELLSDLEALLIDYTEEFPKVQEIRYESGLLQKELERLTGVNPAEAGKLTLALGKLLVRKAELDTDVWSLRKTYNDDYPEVKRAKKKIEIFENAIREIMGGK